VPIERFILDWQISNLKLEKGELYGRKIFSLNGRK
jgi:hypothetical protein